MGKQQKHIRWLKRRQPLAFGGEDVARGQMRALRVAQASSKNELAEYTQKQSQRPEARLRGFFNREHKTAFRPSAGGGEGDEDQQAVKQLPKRAMRDSQRVRHFQHPQAAQ